MNQIHFAVNLSVKNKKEIIDLIINRLFKEKFDILAYSTFSFEDDIYQNKKLIGHSVLMGLYSVHYQNLFPITKQNKPHIAFDMVLV